MTHDEIQALEGAELDAAVARALGYKYVAISPDGKRCWAGVNHQDQDSGFFEPSERGDHGVPIIERELISIAPRPANDFSPVPYWAAIGYNPNPELYQAWFWSTGPTALIAAMRAYVASKK